jgi:hypothetical protein
LKDDHVKGTYYYISTHVYQWGKITQTKHREKSLWRFVYKTSVYQTLTCMPMCVYVKYDIL